MESPSSPRRRWVRAAWMVMPAAAFIVVLALGVAGTTTGPPGPGDPAPSFRGPLLMEEGALALEDLRGKPVFLNFWASWCVPCEDEAPMIEDARRTFGDRIAFVGINIRDARSEARRFVEDHGLDFPHVRDESLEIYDAYGLTGQPESFFIHADGTIAEHIPGQIPTRERLLSSLRALVSRDA